MQCFSQAAPTAQGGRQAAPRAAGFAHEEPDAQNAADSGRGIFCPSSKRRRYGSRCRVYGFYPAAG